MRDQTDFLLGLFLGTVLGVTVALLIAPREGAATRQRLLDQGHRLTQQGEATLSHVTRPVKQRSEEALALAAPPFVRPKAGWKRRWPW